MQKKFFTLFFTFLSLAFLTNFLWESLHAVFLYRGLSIIGIERYVQLMLNVSLKDMLWLAFSLLGIGLYFRDWFWFEKFSPSKLRAMLVVPLVVAILIEVQGVFIFNKWSYSPLMPKVLGLGVSPLLQLPATFIFCVLVLRGMTHGSKSNKSVM